MFFQTPQIDEVYPNLFIGNYKGIMVWNVVQVLKLFISNLSGNINFFHIFHALTSLSDVIVFQSIVFVIKHFNLGELHRNALFKWNTFLHLAQKNDFGFLTSIINKYILGLGAIEIEGNYSHSELGCRRSGPRSSDHRCKHLQW